MLPVIDVRDVHRIYDSGGVPTHALRGVSLTVRKGEFLCIMGPSGSGKSTLMNILGCLDTPTSGSYLLEGVDVAKRYSVKAYPTFLILDSDGEEVGRIVGGADADRFIEEVRKVLENIER